MKVRPSSRPLFAACPSSQQECANPVDSDSAPARTGTATHEAIAATVNGLEPDLASIAKRYDVNENEVGVLYTRALRLLEDVDLTRAQAEVKVEGPLCRGVVDLLTLPETPFDDALVDDWKTGWLDNDHEPQMEGYAHAVHHQFGADTVRARVINLRHGTVEEYRYTPEDFRSIEQRHAERVAAIGRKYNPGVHCGYCRRRNECQARRDFVNASASALVEQPAGQLTPSSLLAAYPRIAIVEKMIADYKAAVRSVLRDGPIAVDGTEYSLGEASRETINAAQAWRVLQDEGFTDNDLASILSVKKSGMESIISDRHANGSKAEAKRQVMDKLREAGAVSVSRYTKINKKRVET